MDWFRNSLRPCLFRDFIRVSQNELPHGTTRNFTFTPPEITNHDELLGPEHDANRYTHPEIIARNTINILDELLGEYFNYPRTYFRENPDNVVRIIVYATHCNTLLRLVAMLQNQFFTSQFDFIINICRRGMTLAIQYIQNQFTQRLTQLGFTTTVHDDWVLVREDPLPVDADPNANVLFRFSPHAIADGVAIFLVRILYPGYEFPEVRQLEPVDSRNFLDVERFLEFLNELSRNRTSHSTRNPTSRQNMEYYDLIRYHLDETIAKIKSSLTRASTLHEDASHWAYLRPIIRGQRMRELRDVICTCQENLFPADPRERERITLVVPWKCNHFHHAHCIRAYNQFDQGCPFCRNNRTYHNWRFSFFPSSAIFNSIYLTDEQRTEVATMNAEFENSQRAERERLETANRARLVAEVQAQHQQELERLRADLEAQRQAEVRRLEAELAARPIPAAAPPPAPVLPAEEIARIFQENTQALNRHFEERERQRTEQFEAERRAQQQELQEIMRQARETFRSMQDPSGRVAERRMSTSIVVASGGGARRIPILPSPDIIVPDSSMTYINMLHMRQIASPASIEIDSTLTDCMNDEELFEFLTEVREMLFAVLQIKWRNAEVTYSEGGVNFTVTANDIDAQIKDLFSKCLPYFHPKYYNMQPVIDFSALVLGETTQWQELEQRCISGRFSSPKYDYKYAPGDGGGGPGPAGGDGGDGGRPGPAGSDGSGTGPAGDGRGA